MAQTRWHKSESVYDEPRSFQNLHYRPKMAFNLSGISDLQQNVYLI